MESLLSPVLAAVALTFMSFGWLFLGTSAGFLVSALLVLSTRIPDARPSTHTKAWDKASAGIRTFLRTPRLRGIMALNLVVAAAGSMVVVNTVNYVRDELGGSQSDVAWMLAASGTGTLLAALALPRVLDRITARTVMMTGAGVLVGSTTAAVTLIAAGLTTWTGTAIIWTVVGIGMALIITPTGKVLRASVGRNVIPEAFAAQFSLSHLAVDHLSHRGVARHEHRLHSRLVPPRSPGRGGSDRCPPPMAAPRRTRSHDHTRGTRPACAQQGPVRAGQGRVKRRVQRPDCLHRAQHALPARHTEKADTGLTQAADAPPQTDAIWPTHKHARRDPARARPRTDPAVRVLAAQAAHVGACEPEQRRHVNCGHDRSTGSAARGDAPVARRHCPLWVDHSSAS
jgi:hypothetical protein